MSRLNDYSADEHQPLSGNELEPCSGDVPKNCRSRWKYELFDKGYGIFDVVEESLGLGSYRVMDIEKCFAPSRKFHLTALARLFMFACTVIMYFKCMFHEWYDDRRFMFFSYLTNWTFTFTVVYQLLVLLISLRPSIIMNQSSSDKPGYIVTIIWLLYSFVLPMNILVTSMYWILEYPTKKTPVDFYGLFPHGISCLLVVLDGFYVATIPLRMKQVIFTMIYSFAYTTWTLIHGLVIQIGDGINKDTPLYTVLDWKNNPIGTLIIVSILAFVAVPLIFTLLWTLSLCSQCCKFDGSHRPTIIRQIEGSQRNNDDNVDGLYGSINV